MHELLSPAGDIESLLEAIHNGCDAVYLGLKSFGARKFSKNFDNEEIVEALKYAHLYGVKVYVTMNTLVKDNEVGEFLKQVEFLHKNGVDAILMQDFGMINLVRKKYPNLEIHASTQTNNSSVDTIRMFYKLGVKRVVLSRELSLEEIKKIDVPIEKEVFVHGALCISYSGNCLMSSVVFNRSGNRGECNGSCRLKYDLYEDDKLISKDKYLLSTKELNTSYSFKELLDTDIKSFKIEGRMKSPLYVGFITNFYRRLIDGVPIRIEEEIEKLKTIYNRDFTLGNLFNSKDIMNIGSPNHIGLEIGKVIKITPKKIKIKLSRYLNQEDGIRFLESGKGFIVNFLYNEKDKLISKAKKGDIIYVDNKVNLDKTDIVCKTLDKKLNEELEKYEKKKIPVFIKVEAKLDKNLKITISDYINKITLEGNKIERAKTSPTSREDIKRQIFKLGNTPFICNDIELSIDKDIFISIREINELRREVCASLINKRIAINEDIKIENVTFSKLKNFSTNYLTCSVSNEEQLLACLKLDFKRIYVRNNNLYEKYKDSDRIYLYLERNMFFIEKNLKDRNLVSEYFEFKINSIGNYTLNVENIYTGYYLLEKLESIPLSVELTKKEIEDYYYNFKNKFQIEPPLEVLVYGRIENMIIKNNILELEEGKTYDLVDKQKRKFKTYYHDKLTHILNYENITRDNFNIPIIKRFDFFDEQSKDIVNIVDKLK